MRIASSRGIGGLGDPSFDARRRWRMCAFLDLPCASWSLAGHDASALDRYLEAACEDVPSALRADAGVMAIVRDVAATTPPDEVLRRLEELAASRDPAPLPPVTVDRGDPLADVALGCSLGVEAHAVDLLADPAARELLAWIEKRLPRSYWHRLASVIRVSVELAKAQLVELLVDLAVLDVERAEREALEAPAREAARRVQEAAAAARARIEAEIAS